MRVRGPDLDAACRDLEEALRARLCVTFVRIRLHRSTQDLEYVGSAGGRDDPPRGASVRLMIRDARGIVGEIDVIDGCHPTCTGRAVQEMATIVEEHAAPLREAVASAEPRAAFLVRC